MILASQGHCPVRLLSRHKRLINCKYNAHVSVSIPGPQREAFAHMRTKGHRYSTTLVPRGGRQAVWGTGVFPGVKPGEFSPESLHGKYNASRDLSKEGLVIMFLEKGSCRLWVEGQTAESAQNYWVKMFPLHRWTYVWATYAGFCLQWIQLCVGRKGYDFF